jgi:molybdopterin-guanine dinucleotide biosynthesis protein A
MPMILRSASEQPSGVPVNARLQAPIGVLLAGGLGRRIGGSKAVVELQGKPLIAYPLEAIRQVLDEVAIIVKPDTELPSLPGVTVWIEPPGRHHPLLGIIHALGLAGGRPVLVCAADMPFVSPALINRIASVQADRPLAVVASCAGAIQPLLGCYQPEAIDPLRTAADAARPAREAIAELEPRLVEVEDPETLFNINSPDDLLQAAAMLDRRQPRV